MDMDTARPLSMLNRVIGVGGGVGGQRRPPWNILTLIDWPEYRTSSEQLGLSLHQLNTPDGTRLRQLPQAGKHPCLARSSTVKCLYIGIHWDRVRKQHGTHPMYHGTFMETQKPALKKTTPAWSLNFAPYSKIEFISKSVRTAAGTAE